MAFKSRLVRYLCLVFVGVALVSQLSEENPFASVLNEDIITAEPHSFELLFHGVPLRTAPTRGTANVYAANWSIRAY